MDKKLILRRFIKFLKKNNIYKEYVYSLINGSSYRIRVKYEANPVEFIVHALRHPNYLISRAFAWSYCPSIDWFHYSHEWVLIVKYELKIKI